MTPRRDTRKRKSAAPTHRNKHGAGRAGTAMARLLALIGQRWTLRVLWELRPRAQTFRALRARCDDVSPTLLNRRLAELRRSALVVLGDNGYRLTRQGRALADRLLPLRGWARRWVKRRR